MKLLLKYLYCKYIKFKKSSVESLYVSMHASVGEGTVIARGTCVASWVHIGKYSYINTNSNIEGNIGHFCSIGQNCAIGGGSHATEFLSTSQRFYSTRSAESPPNVFGDLVPFDDLPLKAEIGSDVWIGAYSVILAGVKIGDGAVIGANSVVTKDIPPYAIAVGNPAKVIKYRFEEEQITWLLKTKWWDLPSEQLKEYRELFASGEKWWELAKARKI